MPAGVDSYGEVAAGLAVREREATRPAFESSSLPGRGARGTLEATRMADPPVVVCGAKDGGQWQVCAVVGGFRVTMPPAAARALAGELVTYAELAEAALRDGPSQGSVPPQGDRGLTS